MSVVIGLDHPDATETAITGGKGANLAKTMQAGFPVPRGFCVRTEAYTAFVEANGLEAKIAGVLDGLDTADNDALESSTERIRDLIEGAEVSAESAEAIRAAYGELEGEPYVAVRSSGTAEDLAEASFAGMHETYLDVRGGDEVVDAVRLCWASLWTPRATSYRADKGFEHSEIGISVVVQEMIASEVSGVMFTGNPINAATDEIVINASWGLGEAVVQGIATPDSYIVKHRNLHIRDKEIGGKEVRIVRDPDAGHGVITEDVPDEERARFTLAAEQVEELADLGRRVQDHYEEMPQDIEWAYAGGEMYLLQARPITGVEFSWDADVDDWYELEDDDEDYWSRTWADEGWTGAITPLMYSWRAPSWIAGHDPAAKLWGLDQELVPIRMWKYHKGEGYWNLRKEKLYTELTMPPQFRKLGVVNHMPESWVDETLEKPFNWLEYAKLYGRMNFLRPQKDRLWGWMKHFDQYYFVEQVEYANGPSNEELRKMNDKELRKTVMRYKDFEDRYNAVFWTGAFIYVRDAMCSLLMMLRAWHPEDADQLYMELMSGSFKRTPTIIENHTLWQFAQKIKDSEPLSEALANSTAHEFFRNIRGIPGGDELLSEYDEFVAETSHRGHADRDVYFPRRSEDPTADYNALKGYVTVDEDPEERETAVNENREAVLEKVVEEVKKQPMGFLKAEAIKIVVDWMQRFIVFRDTERNCIDRSTFTIKRCFLEAGRRCQERGLLETERDFWFLTVDELWELMAGKANMKLARAKIEARMRNWDRFDTKEYAPPMYLHKGQAVDLDTPADGEEEEGVLRGSGTSSGTVTGTARVVKSLAGLGELSKDEILVCNATDPGWTAAFSLIKGIVTETGGPLAHAACLAREYGLPAAQIERAVQLIPDGATITVDGVAGKVIIVDPAGNGQADGAAADADAGDAEEDAEKAEPVAG